MPDWFYRTVSQPLLFGLPANSSRRFVLGFMGALGNLPGGIGRAVIDFMGHMAPPAGLRKRMGSLDVAGPVGASCWFDGEGRALAAWTRFGFALIELGPTWVEADSFTNAFARDDFARALETTPARQRVAPSELRSRAMAAPREKVQLMARLRPPASASPAELVAQTAATQAALGDAFTAWSLDLADATGDWSSEDWKIFWRELTGRINTDTVRRTLFLVLTPQLVDGPETQTTVLEAGAAAGVRNWLCEYSEQLADGRQRLGGPAGVGWLATQIRQLRQRLSGEHHVISSGSVIGVEQASALRDAGADLVLLDSGMVFSGPGLPKRINEAIVATAATPLPVTEPALPESVFRQSWFWGAMLGLAMFIGSLLALAIASTRVILPYDEVFCGLSREQLSALNPRLLLFLAHDRVSLAGTMIAIGVLYGGMSLWGIRRGIHWPRVAVFWSAGVGFASFFLFLVFGYFDPFHGFVTAILFQLYLQCMVASENPLRPASLPDRTEDCAWRHGQWGQLLLVIHGTGLLLAGLTITTVGLLDVFVATDLEFLESTADVLRQASDRLIPMIAHDRATMGGMLIAAGIPFLLGALWGIGRGTRWLWWTMLLAGVPPYVCAIGVHFVIGYVNFFHLLPAFFGLGLFVAGLFACRAWMWDDGLDRSARVAASPQPDPGARLPKVETAA